MARRHGDPPDVVRKSSIAEVSRGKERGSGGKIYPIGVALQGKGRTQERKGETPYGRRGEPKGGIVEEN